MKRFLVALLLLSVVGQVCGSDTAALIQALRVSGAGDDSAARLELRTMSHAVAAPRAKSTERKAHVSALLAGLESQSEPALKRVIMRELQYIGSKESVPALAGYLGDPELCEPASQALLGIATTCGPKGIADILADAFLRSTLKTEVTLAKACGSLKVESSDVHDRLIQMLASADWRLRGTAMRALAYIGREESSAALLDAIESSNLYQRTRAIQLNFLYAREFGADDRSGGVQHCRAVMACLTESEDAPFFLNGLETLISLEGKSVLEEVVGYLGDPNPRLRTGVASILREHDSWRLRSELKAALEEGSALARIQVLSILVASKPSRVGKVVVEFMDDDDATLRAEARVVSTQLKAKTVVPALLRSLLNSDDAEALDVHATLRQFALSPAISEMMIDSYTDATNAVQKTRILALLEAQSVPGAGAVMLVAAEDAELRKVALKGLRFAAQGADIEGLLAALSTATASSDIGYLRYGLIRAIEDPDAEIDLLVAALERAEGAQRTALFTALAKSSDSAATERLNQAGKSSDLTVQKDVIQALAAAPGDRSVRLLADLLPRLKEANFILAARGLLQGLQASTLPKAEQLEILAAAQASATRAAEKSAITAAIENIRTQDK